MTSYISLPSTLFLLVLASLFQTISAEAQWQNSANADVNCVPEHDALVRRGLESMKKIQYQNPIGMRKMSTDPDEMFFLDYWEFEDSNSEDNICPINRSDYTPGANESYSNILQPPVLLHSSSKPESRHALFARYNLFAKRDFQCPINYSNCSSANAPSLCCPNGQTCINIQNNGAGTVGCCPANANCGSTPQVGGCASNQGYNSCSGVSNGGCCIPGFTCYGTGCISYTTSTTTITVAGGTATICAASSASCAASFGGQCCASGLTCTSSGSCFGPSAATMTSSAPTSNAAGTAILAGTTTDSANVAATPAFIVTNAQTYGVCPTGYYFCSAYFRPGCCRVDRFCSTTNCPAASLTSVFVSNGVTISVPIGPFTGGASYQTVAHITSTGAAAPGGGSCPQGWSLCAPSNGGNCCMAGWSCGQSCMLGTSVTPKVAPSAQTGKADVLIVAFIPSLLIAGGLAAGAAMVIL